MGLYHLLYQSQALTPFDTPALTALLYKCRAFNRAHYLSGLLLHTPDGRFLQILEGEEAVVNALYYDRIAVDPRHHSCRVLGAGACAERSFADWNMGFRVANTEELYALLANDTLTEPVLPASQPHFRPELLQLLLDFVANHEYEPTGYL